MKNVNDLINHCLYINLEHREDRRNHINNQFYNILNIPIERFNAIQHKKGAIGCSLSHIKCLQLAKERNWEYVMIVEDDIQFLQPDVFKKNLNGFLERNIEFDVLLLAGNNFQPYHVINKYCARIFNCQTTTGYIVKKHYYDTLINNIKQSVLLLLKEPHKSYFYAIDIWWKQLQRRDTWYLLLPITIIQMESYSDIEKRNTNYGNAMLKFNK